MYLLLTDETNQRPGQDARFFIFGGVVVPLERIETLHDRISEIREAAGYRRGDKLKFETNARPDYVSIGNATEAKRQIIVAAMENRCEFIAQMIHHNVIGNQQLDQQVTWAADYVLGRFNQYLIENSDTGICAVDNLPAVSQFQYLSEKFAVGLTLPDGSQVPLDRIRLFSATSAGASYLSSIMDIILGSFRYCLNNPRNNDAASEMMRNVVSLMWGGDERGYRAAQGKGLIVRPVPDQIRSPRIRREYDEVFEHVDRLLQADEI